MEWHEVFKGVAEAEVPAAVLEEEAQERRGLFGRLRRNLGKARGGGRATSSRAPSTWASTGGSTSRSRRC